jgi:hypothetical protein
MLVILKSCACSRNLLEEKDKEDGYPGMPDRADAEAIELEDTFPFREFCSVTSKRMKT